ncbi:ribosomal-processing cysteine protease Prp [Sporolactobacillus terrae]|uniref:Ribosomal processing cysteine protease Prp n=1 Tax=Sporolactobacillus terrae TaxID=269673 RepID=A0ABX5Q8H2_9BACL|nr:ribosomal-processing cysteine protease Prp [Sporolactobacillus terrae]QAA22919.1 ribosomal-processing cysteine protease Prp [Sporolactobacillus terrae]QAA25892.1 ribosomal-processing cysteine protease Prp [Sporolactobacillus terrae]UAK17767.1 ribosomal-processing cysteine protease Prp [Sporolactobacillus terrae]
MVNLTIHRDPHGQIVAFNLTGHADSGPYGSDLVCAAVSAVAFGSVNAVESLANLQLDVRQKDSGYLECAIPDYAAGSDLEKAQLILEAMLISMRTIEQSYGQYIRISD